ncbi:MAG: hypothetical protein Fur0010_06050 [Bdellovibrio sp.]
MLFILAIALFFSQPSFAQTANRYSSQAQGSYKADESSTLTNESMTLISAIATSLVVKELFTACRPLTLDMTLAGAGAGIYLVGELMTLLKYREISEKQIDYAKNGNLTDAQVQALQETRNNYNDQKKAVDTKLNLLYAAAAAYTAAAASAGIQWFKLNSAFTTHIANIRAAKGTISGAMATDATACVGTAVTCQAGAVGSAALTKLELFATLLTEWQAFFNSPSQSRLMAAAEKTKETKMISFIEEMKTAAVPIETTATGNAMNAEAAKLLTSANALVAQINPTTTTCDPEAVIKAFANHDSNLFLKKYFVAHLMTNLFFPKAEASFLNKWGLPIGIVAALVMSAKGLVQFLDLWIYSPAGRTKLWGIMAGTMAVAAMTTKSMLTRIENEIKEIDGILSKYKAYQGSHGALTNSIQHINIDQSDLMRRNMANYKPDEVLMSGPRLNSNGNCLLSQPNGNCLSAGRAVQTFIGDNGTPGVIAQTAIGAGNLADSLAGGQITGGTLNTAAALGNQLAKLTKAREQIDKQLPPLTAGKNKPISDFDSFFSNGVNARIKKVLGNKASPSDLGSLFKSMGAPSSEKAKEALNELAKFAPPESQTGSGSSAGISETSAPSFNFSDISDSSGGNVAVLDAAEEAAEPDYNFDAGRDQIHQNKDVNIFDILSHRYLKTAYPVFFKSQ